MKFQCLFCQEIIAVDNGDCGTNVRCGSCNEVVQVPSSRVATGAVISDFLILQEIGRGGMGVVYLAHQISLARPAALKVLADQYVRNVEFITNFIKEARAAAKLNHPHIVQAYAVGEDEGVYYFAMEHIDGETLKSKLKREHRLPIDQALAIIQQIAEALDYAWNEARIIHCDIKPDNIMLTANGRAKLADLGLARMAGDPEHNNGDEVMGTPQYISPEQLTGAPMDGRTDIYSLGATFYHMITGHFPFEGRNATDIARKHLQEPLISPRKHVADIPTPICSIIHKMMSKDPNERYQDASALVEDLRLVRMGKPPTTAGSHTSSSAMSMKGKKGSTMSTKMGRPGSGKTTTTGMAAIRGGMVSTNTQDLLVKTDSIQTMKPMNAAELKRKRADEAKKQMVILLFIILVLVGACAAVLVWSFYKPTKKLSHEVPKPTTTATSTKVSTPDTKGGGTTEPPVALSGEGKSSYEKAAGELIAYNKKIQEAPDLLVKLEEFFRRFPDPANDSEKVLCLELRKLYAPIDEKGNRLDEIRQKKRAVYDERIKVAEENSKKKMAAEAAAKKKADEEAEAARKDADKKKSEDQKIADYDEDLKTRMSLIRAGIVDQVKLKDFESAKKKFEKEMNEEAKFKEYKEEPRVVNAMREKARGIAVWATKMKQSVEAAEKLWSSFVNSDATLKGLQVEIGFMDSDGKKKTPLGKIEKISNGEIILVPVMGSTKPITIPINEIQDGSAKKSPIPQKVLHLLNKFVEKAPDAQKSNAMFHFYLLNGVYDEAEKVIPQSDAEFWKNEITELKKAKK